MKKLIVCMLLAVMTMAAQATTPKTIFNKYKETSKAEYLHIPRLLISFAAKSDPESKEVLKNISSVNILNLEECTKEVKDAFREDVTQLTLDGYEEVVNSTDKNENTRIFMLFKEDSIREILVVDASDSDAALVQVKGKFTQEDFQKMMEEPDKLPGKSK